MTSTLEMAKALGFVITTAIVKALDYSGWDCSYCSEEGALVEVQLYYTLEGERFMEEGCGGCMLSRMFEVSRLGVDTFHTETEEK